MKRFEGKISSLRQDSQVENPVRGEYAPHFPLEFVFLCSGALQAKVGESIYVNTTHVITRYFERLEKKRKRENNKWNVNMLLCKKLNMQPTAAFVTIMPWFEWFGLNMLMMVVSVLNRVHWRFSPSAHFQSKALLQNNLINTAGQLANKKVSLEWARPPSRLNKLSKHSSDRTSLITPAGYNSGSQLRFVPSRYQRAQKSGWCYQHPITGQNEQVWGSQRC